MVSKPSAATATSSASPDTSRKRTAPRRKPGPTSYQAGATEEWVPAFAGTPAIDYGRMIGPRVSATVAAFSFQSFDHGVTGRGTSIPSTRIASTCSLKNDKRPLIFGHSGIGSGYPHTISGYSRPPILADQ